MTTPLHHPQESSSNAARDLAARFEPKALRTFTPSLAVLAHSAGVYHWTPEGRRLHDFTSGVLVANLGHNPESWMRRVTGYMGGRGYAGGGRPPPPAGAFFSAAVDPPQPPCPGGLFFVAADDRLQRRHAGRGRGKQSPA